MLKIIHNSFIKFCILVTILTNSCNILATPSLKDYGTLPSVSMVKISPDGSLVAFRKVQDNRDLLVVTSLSDNKIISMLDIAKIQPNNLMFLNDHQLYFLASEYQRVAGFKGKFDTSTGFVLDLNSQKIRQLLTPGSDGIYPGQSGLGRIIGISADGDYAYMPSYLGDPTLLDRDDPNYGLVKVKLSSNGKPKAITPGTPHSKEFFTDNQGNLLAEERYNEKTNEHSIWTFDKDTKKLIFKEIIDFHTKSFVGLTPDYSALVFLETNNKSGRVDYYLMDLKSGKISNTNFGRENADIESEIRDQNQIVRGVVYSGFTPSYKFFDPKLDARVQSIVDQFSDHSVHIVSMTPDTKQIIVLIEGSLYAEEYFLFSENDSNPRFLTTSHPNIKAEDINPIGKLTYTARDGLKIPTLITIPKEKISAIKNLPAVIYPHGGPEAHDTIGFDFMAQALASNGYLVIQPQFRGSDGFGAAHALAGHGEWGKKMQDDLTDAIKFFAAKGYIDPNKVCIVGASYGGYAALAGGAFTPALYKCVVSINGIGDVYDQLQWDKSFNGKNSEVAAYMEEQFAKGEIDKKELAKMSPEKSAANFTAPVLLIHSENDKRVPYRQSANMQSALKKAKKPVQLIKLEGENHHLLESKTRLQALEETVKFVNSHLK